MSSCRPWGFRSKTEAHTHACDQFLLERIPHCLLQADKILCCLTQGVVLRVATFVVLRYGSTLSKISVHRFFTLCWMRVSATCARWRSLRAAAWGRTAPSTGLEVRQPLLQAS